MYLIKMNNRACMIFLILVSFLDDSVIAIRCEIRTTVLGLIETSFEECSNPREVCHRFESTTAHDLLVFGGKRSLEILPIN